MNAALVLGLLVFVLSGCQGPRWWVMRNPAGQEVLGNICVQGYTQAQCDAGVLVTVTKNPADEEFWRFEPRSSFKDWLARGMTVQYYPVIGSQAACEAARAGEGFPTKSCTGPFYFRREAK
jgi:hypothetical protein